MILIVKKNEEIETSSLNVADYQVVTVSEIVDKKMDISGFKSVIVLGGDGSILRTIHYTKNLPKVFAFNFGTLGFLTTFLKKDISRLQEILQCTTFISRKRLRMGEDTHFLNEVVLTSRKRHLNAFKVKMLGTEYDLRGDSLIISTPSGSTGYNHSVGGPTLLCDSIVISIVAPSKCNFRPLVVGLDTEIEAEIYSNEGLVIADGVEYNLKKIKISFDGNEVLFGCLRIFSPDGRLIQVEYAQQASEQGSLVVFSSIPGRICVSIEVKSQNKMLIDSMKLFKVDTDQNIWMSYSGLKPDSDKVLDCARIICRNNKILTGEDISIDKLAYELSKFKQKYTLGGKMRPLGIRTVLFYVGDTTKIVVVEPDGNYSEWSSGAVGQKSVKVCDFIEKNISEDVVSVSVSALGTVVQSDKNKIMSYLIQKDGIKEVDSNTIDDLIKKISVQ